MGITYTNMRIYDITEADKENLTTILNECELDEQYRITIKKIIILKIFNISINIEKKFSFE